MKDIKKQITWMTLFCFLIAIIGCSSNAAFVYTPMSQFKSTKKFPARVAVKAFLDQRGNNNKNYSLLALIPIVPFGIEEYNRPEAGSEFGATQTSYQIRPPEDFSKALVTDLKASNMFEEVFYTERELPKDADLVIEGTINSTDFRGEVITYCLSFAAAYLWFFGLPVGHSSNEIVLSLRLITAKDGNTVLERSYNKQTSQTGGLYYSNASYCEGYARMVEDINRDFVTAIEGEFTNKPPEFWKSIKQ